MLVVPPGVGTDQKDMAWEKAYYARKHMKIAVME